MKYDKYTVQASSSFLTYEFQSKGPSGVVTKRVRFARSAENPNVFDMGFGDYDETGNLDYFVVTNNKDTDKVLATVVLTIIRFFDRYPDKAVYFQGSTPARTRLYRIAITKNLTEARKEFHLFGILNGESHKFEVDVDYTGFLIQKKK